MKIDLYLRVVLTAIAVCLVWLCLGKVILLPEAEAQYTNATGRWQLFQGSYSEYDFTEPGDIFDKKGVFLLNTETGNVFRYERFLSKEGFFDGWKDTGKMWGVKRDEKGFQTK